MHEHIPAPIAEALFKIAEEIRPLAKSEYNEHNSYTFVPIDDYYAHLQPLCIKHGLLVVPVERDQKFIYINNKPVLSVAYSFRFIHRSGVSWCDKDEIRRVRLYFTGAQSSATAQSYLHKAYFRGLWCMITGEEDADVEADIVERPKKDAAKGKKPAKASSQDVDLDDPETPPKTTKARPAVADQDKAKPAAVSGGQPDTAVDTKLASKGPVLIFTIEGKTRTLRPNEVLDAVTPELRDMFPGDKDEWLRRNQTGMNELMTLSKPTWLKVKKLLDGPSPGDPA